MQRLSLPPLDLLQPFEASARLGSFTRAAEELSVTQSAISQRVRKLEDLMGIELFERHHRKIVLTAQGRELLNGVRAALQHLSAATNSLRLGEDRPNVRLSADVSMAHFWLLERLQPRLADGTPVTIDLTVTDDEAELLAADIALMHGGGTWPGFRSAELFRDEVFPVCTPAYQAKSRIETPQDLLRCELIDLDYIHWNWMNWGIWLTEAGVDATRAPICLRTNSYTALLDAARRGLGVTLGWAGLVDEDLQAGRLIRPLENSVRSAFGYYLLLRDGAPPAARDVAGQLAPSIFGAT
ncbi:LysR substrate-binding domain-containing protein [Roseovarius aestuariivivens]|uniref:LysR substrate-binding domain-containing protein n=1 Tax=Roseovarius aestuariivivens TaxID=1888910 RepID=UPI001081E169|nr:LysR substrate-binding domain-containing protein [Roseovarius aestuariivivens]